MIQTHLEQREERCVVVNILMLHLIQGQGGKQESSMAVF